MAHGGRLNKGEGRTTMSYGHRSSSDFTDLTSTGDDGVEVARYYLDAGDYSIARQTIASARSTTTGDKSHCGSGLAIAVFGRPGTAPAVQTGAATPYLSLPATNSCVTGAVATKVTDQAAQVEKVAVSASGGARRSVVRPASGATIIVGAPLHAATTVKVTVTLTSGAVKTGARTCLPCAPAS